MLVLEDRAWQARLTNDTLHGPRRQFRMQGHRHGCCSGFTFSLHHNVASPLPNSLKPMLFQDAADGFA